MRVSAGREDPQPTVGVRELRQNLSKYLSRVKAGETLEVTEHGQRVAVLAPPPPAGEGILDRLIREGRARPANGNLLDVEPLPRGATKRPLSEVLAEMREEERF